MNLLSGGSGDDSEDVAVDARAAADGPRPGFCCCICSKAVPSFFPPLLGAGQGGDGVVDGGHLGVDGERGAALYGRRAHAGVGAGALEAGTVVVVADSDDLAALDEDCAVAGGEGRGGGLGEALGQVAVMLGRRRRLLLLLLLHFDDGFGLVDTLGDFVLVAKCWGW